MKRLIYLIVGFVLPLIVVWGHGNIHEILDELNVSIQASPNDPRLLLNRANLQRQHGEYEDALLDLARVERISSDLPERYLVFAKVQLDRGQWKSALEALDSFIEFHPRDSEPYSLRSRALRQLGKLKRAEQDALRAIELHDRAPLQLYLDYIDLLVLQDSRQDALVACTQAESSLGSLPVLLMHQAQILSNYGRFYEAAAIYAKLRALHPNLSFNCWVKEAAMWANEDSDEAIISVQQAKLAWEALTDRMRVAMQSEYEELLNIENKRTP